MGFLQKSGFSDSVRKCGTVVVAATVDLYRQITEGLLPTPAKFHYTFNLRDISKVFQGILMVKPISAHTPDIFARLWIHETSRVFMDRLTNEADRDLFRENVIEILKMKFRFNWNKEDVFENDTILFSNLLKVDSEDKLYEEVTEKRLLLRQLNN